MAGGAIGITVSTNAYSLAAAFGELGHKQLPFAAATALTRVAIDGRAEVVARMPDHFGKHPARPISARVLKTVRVERAEKKDWPHPKAKVGILDAFMARQVTGGVKLPEKGAKHIAVPTRLIKRGTGGGIPARLKPRPLRERKDVFVLKDQIRGRFADRGRLAETRAANLGGTGTFYSLVTEAHLKAIWPMPKEVARSAHATYMKHFQTELEAAVRSARVRAGHFSSEDGRSAYLAKRTAMGRIPGN